VSDTGKGAPANRLLMGTVAALRARRQLPRRDPRKTSARWLLPNWPDEMVISLHRRRLIEALTRDEALRREVRSMLRIALLDDLGGPGSGERAPGDAAELLAAAIAAANDPIAVMESAATDDNPEIAGAAAPYLAGDLSLPATTAGPPGSVGRQDSGNPERERELRHKAHEAAATVKSLRRQLRLQAREINELRSQLSATTERAERAETSATDMRRQLPTRRQREALETASSHQDKLDAMKRTLDQERAIHKAQVRRLRGVAFEAEAALVEMQDKLDSEIRGRHKLEADLGDDAGRRASRFLPLVAREATDLRQRTADMPDGPAKTRQLRRARQLDDLMKLLGQLYELDPPRSPVELPPRDYSQRTERSSMQVRSRGLVVTPIGGASHIGGSSLLVEAGGTRVLVDAGLKPQAHISRPGPDRIEEAIQNRVDAVVVTHAHADHAGFVPWVVERQRSTRVLCSPQTKALLPVVWADSVRVMRAEADGASSRDNRLEPPYGEVEVEQAENRLVAAGYGRTVQVGELEVTLFPAGHILGAAGVVIRAGDQRVVVTGDIDNRGQTSVGPAQIPSRLAGEADLLVIESTYCDRTHADRDQEGAGLIRMAEEVLSVGGRVLIPAFGLGRAQEVALLLAKELPEVDVLIDGIAIDISELYALNSAPEVFTGKVRKVEHRRREITGFREGVIITTSGMLTGGAAIPWAQTVLTEADSALFLCGHQDEEAPGRVLQELADADPGSPRQVHLRDDHGRLVTIDVAASVHTYNLSAHADSNGLRSIVDEVRPGTVMLVHGESGPQALFRTRLNAAGYAVTDNRMAWDAETIIADTRMVKTRHIGRTHGRRRHS
jgi:Cft2 family RNA processing exonuclease